MAPSQPQGPQTQPQPQALPSNYNPNPPQEQQTNIPPQEIYQNQPQQQYHQQQPHQHNFNLAANYYSNQQYYQYQSGIAPLPVIVTPTHHLQENVIASSYNNPTYNNNTYMPNNPTLQQLSNAANASPHPNMYQLQTGGPGSSVANRSIYNVNPQGSFGAPWTTGLFDCMDDPTNALMTAVLPCMIFGQIADVLDNGHTTCATSGIMYMAVPCNMSRPYRRKLRLKFGLAEHPFPDWFVHMMFEPCALCQEYRELRNRGLDPALGYHGNLNRKQNQQTAATMMPPNNQVMN